MRVNSQRGFTLLELMIVVVVVGVLAGIALFTFGGKTSETQVEAEVSAIFTEVQLRQEQFHVEHGRYHSTGTGEIDKHPSEPSGPESPNDFRPLPAEWQELRVQSDKAHVYCAYVTIAGAASDNTNVGSRASGTFGFAAPGRDWYYVLAECDADGDSSKNSFYFARSDNDRIQAHNKKR